MFLKRIFVLSCALSALCECECVQSSELWLEVVM